MFIRKLLIGTGLAGLLLTAWAIASESDYQEEQAQTNLYCTMITLHKETGGEYGWPAYQGEEICP